MIGIVDADLFTHSTDTTLYVPNLEAMKLASYYKIEERRFVNLLSLDETNLSGYKKIFFCSELGDTPVPLQYRRAKNVEYIGSCFTKGVYQPFGNQLIDFTIPRTFLYKNFLSEKYNAGAHTKDINNFLDNSYYRMYAGEEKLPLPVVKKKKRIYLFDRDIFSYSDWEETLQALAERNPSRIETIHPIYCKRLSDFFKLRENAKFSRTNEIILDLKVPTDEIHILFNKFKNKFLADINDSSNVFLPLGEIRLGAQTFAKDLYYKLNLLYSFWARGIQIKIKYFPSEANHPNPFEDLEKLIEKECSLTTKAKRERSLIEKIKKKEEINNEYQLFLKYYPDSRSLFKQSFNELKERGVWRV